MGLQLYYRGAHDAVYTSVAKLVAAGADYHKAYLSLQEFFEKLRNEPARWGKPFAALLGALDAQLELSAAAIGGKDSMSGSFLDRDVPPTLISFAIAPLLEGELLIPFPARRRCTPAVKCAQGKQVQAAGANCTCTSSYHHGVLRFSF